MRSKSRNVITKNKQRLSDLNRTRPNFGQRYGWL